MVLKENSKSFLHYKLSLKSVLIISAICFTIIPLTVASTLSLFYVRSTVVEEMDSNAKNSVNLLNDNLNKMIKRQKNSLDYLTNRIKIADITNGNKQDVINTLLSQQEADKDLSQVFVADRSGHFLDTPQSLKIPSDFDPVGRPWFKNAMQNPGKLIVNDPYDSLIAGGYSVTLTKTTADGKGVVGVVINLDNLRSMSASVNIGGKKSSYTYIISPGGQMIAHPKIKAGTVYSDRYLLKQIRKKGSGIFNNVYQGAEKRNFYVTNQETGWTIVGALSQDDINAHTAPVLQHSLTIGIVTALLAVVIALFSVVFITRPINHLTKVARSVASKDLTHRANVNSFVEFQDLGNGFNQMIDALSGVLIHVDEKAASVATSSEELSASTEENKATSDEIARAVQEIAAGSDSQHKEVGTATQNADNIYQEVEKIANQSSALRQKSKAAMDTVNTGKNSLNEVVGQIRSIRTTNKQLTDELNDLVKKMKLISYTNNLINDIAAQTHLLSLNAAIEAARAGEYGRGFSVVATEIQKLAEQSADSTKKIAEIEAAISGKVRELVAAVDNGSTQVDQGMKVADGATQTFLDIEETVRETARATHEMSQSVDQISGATGEIVKRINVVSTLSENVGELTESVSASTEEQSASMEEVATNAASLAVLADELKEITAQFKLQKQQEK